MASLNKILDSQLSQSCSPASTNAVFHHASPDNHSDVDSADKTGLTPPPPSQPRTNAMSLHDYLRLNEAHANNTQAHAAHYDLPALPHSLSSASPSPSPADLAFKDVPGRRPTPVGTMQTEGDHSGTKATRRSRTGFKDLVGLMSAVIDKNPFMATYGQKAKTWQDVVRATHEKGFCLSHKEPTLRRKVDAILSAHQVHNSMCYQILSLTHCLGSTIDWSCSAFSRIDI